MDEVAALLLLAVLLLETVSHLALKSASMHAAGKTGGLDYLVTFAVQPAFWLAIASFAALFLAWLAFLSRVPLGQGVMAGSITIVGVMLGGRLYFHEKLTTPRALAIALIAGGVTLVGWGHG